MSNVVKSISAPQQSSYSPILYGRYILNAGLSRLDFSVMEENVMILFMPSLVVRSLYFFKNSSLGDEDLLAATYAPLQNLVYWHDLLKHS